MSEALATQIGIEAIFYASLAFIIAVSAFWAWWRSQIGWTIVAKSGALAVAVLPAMAFYWFSDQAPAWLRDASIAGLWAVPIILIWRAVVLYRVQRAGGSPK